MPRRNPPPTDLPLAPAKNLLRLTPAQKDLVRARSLQLPRLTRAGLGIWAQSKFGLPKAVPHSTIVGILKPINETRNARINLNLDAYQVLRELDDSLAEWIRTATTLNPTQEMIKIHAEEELKRRLKELNISEDDVVMPQFSNGWLWRFCVRHGVRLRMLSGEAASVREEDVINGRARIKEITKNYAPKDTFNVDETAYTYRDPGKRAMAFRGRRGRKGNKSRISVMVGTNADGSEKLPLLIIHSSGLPVSFGEDAMRWIHLLLGSETRPWGADERDPRALYGQTAKGWQTAALWRRYLMWLDRRMRREGRHILLLVDNVSSHSAEGLELTNVRVEKLPKNTTSVLQPMDQGIIRSWKAKTVRLRARHAYWKWRAGDARPYFIDPWTAVKFAMQAWDEVEKKTIVKCWSKADIHNDGSIRASIHNILC